MVPLNRLEHVRMSTGLNSDAVARIDPSTNAGANASTNACADARAGARTDPGTNAGAHAGPVVSSRLRVCG